MRFRAKYGSHLPMLLKLLSITDGPVLEMGGGWVSTPVLHWCCVPRRRTLLTLDNDPACYEMLRQYDDSYHTIALVEDWDQADIEREFWDIAFIDHAPAERRKEDIRRLANQAEYVVVHDTDDRQVRKHYHYEDIWALYRYRYDYKGALPSTTVLSNFTELKGLME